MERGHTAPAQQGNHGNFPGICYVIFCVVAYFAAAAVDIVHATIMADRETKLVNAMRAADLAENFPPPAALFFTKDDMDALCTMRKSREVVRADVYLGPANETHAELLQVPVLGLFAGTHVAPLPVTEYEIGYTIVVAVQQGQVCLVTGMDADLAASAASHNIKGLRVDVHPADVLPSVKRYKWPDGRTYADYALLTGPAYSADIDKFAFLPVLRM